MANFPIECKEKNQSLDNITAAGYHLRARYKLIVSYAPYDPSRKEPTETKE